MEETHHVVIVGGGFGGLYAARGLKRAPVRVTLVDRRNFHLFQPLLYQVALGWLSPANIASPLRVILSRQKNAKVLMKSAVGVDVHARRLVLEDFELPYDTLILAAGSSHHYFGNEQWEVFAPGLKTVEDATEIRRRILLAFENAESSAALGRERGQLTFVIVGGGPTGLELAGALAELVRDTLRSDFRDIRQEDVRIILLEALDRILPMYPENISGKAAGYLGALGVEVQTGCFVTGVDPERVTIRCGGREETIPTRTVLWGAGVQASCLGKSVAEAAGADVDKNGRLIVEPDLTLPGHPEIIVLGDMAHFSHQGGKPLPGLAAVAMQQGRYAARMVRARLRGEKAGPFHYRDYGSMATIGRGAAVADLKWFHVTGYPAWLLWLFTHLMKLVGFENRLLVFLQWAWYYLTRNRTACLITGEVNDVCMEGGESRQAGTGARGTTKG